MDGDRAEHRMAAELHARWEHDRGVYRDIKDLAVKAQSQMIEIKALLRAIQMPVKI